MDPTNLQKMRQQQPQQSTPRRYDGVNGNPMYDSNNGGHYGMRSASARVPQHRELPFV
jgi:hypothetical protein